MLNPLPDSDESPDGVGAQTGRAGHLAAWQSVASIVAPLTVLSAVLGYVGWVRYRAIFGYFGIQPGLISYTPQDYLLHSGVVGLGGVVFLGLAAAILFVLDWVAIAGYNRFPQRLKYLRVALLVLGVILIFAGLLSAIGTAMRAGVPSVFGATLLALGALLTIRFGLAWSDRQRLLPVAVPAGCAALAVLAGFWALTAYAQYLGEGAARDLDRTADNLPLINVYSREPIDLAGSSVQASRFANQDGSWSYRYTGARLLTYSNDRWFLIPELSSESYRSTVTVLSDSDQVRVEIAVPK